MWHARSDLPLRRDGTARFLPWLIALMVYLASLALAGALTLNAAVERWDRGLAGTLTIELPPAAAGPGSLVRGDGGLAALLERLRGTPGVVRAEALDDDAAAQLLEPWLGKAIAPDELPLPRLVDLRVDPDAPPDLAALRQAIAATAPGALLDDHQSWLGPLFSLAWAIEITAATVLLLIGLAAVLTVVFTIRTGLAIHHGVIEVLHLIGARDGYIASQFERHALRLGLRGGMIGLALAALTLLALGHIAAAVPALGNEIRLLPELRLVALDWALLALLPAAAGLIAMVTARVTVLRALARMP